MEISNSGTPRAELQHASLVDEALGMGANAAHAVADFASHNKLLTAAGTIAVAGGILALTRGEGATVAGEMAEGALAAAGKDVGAAALKDVGTAALTDAGTAAIKDVGVVAMKDAGVVAMKDAGALAIKETGALGIKDLGTGAVSGLSSRLGFNFSRVGMPVISLSALTLAACSQEEKQVKANIYKNADDCTKDGVFTSNYCAAEYSQAQHIHQSTAPVFSEKKDCEDKTGLQCTADTTTTDQQNGSPGHPGAYIYYRPYMSGFMVSQQKIMGDNSEPDHYVGRPAPLYSTSSSSDFVTSHGDPIAKSSGATEVPEHSVYEASSKTSGVTAEGEPGGEAKSAFSRSATSVGEGVSRGGFGGEGEAGGAHGVGGEAGGAHGGGGGE